MSRIMVKVSCLADGFKFRMFSRTAGFLGEVYVFRGTFADFEERGYAVQLGSESCVVLQRDSFRKTADMRFAWFTHSGNQFSGREETVTLDNKKLLAFVRASAEPGGPQEWRGLSVPPCRERPRLIFRCHERLRECLDNKTVRRKLVKFLQSNFNWPYSEKIEFYTDFVPYSFFFQEFCGGKNTMCGGVILHKQEDVAKAYYSIHT